MNAANFCDIAPCSPYVNRRFGGKYHIRLQNQKSEEQETGVQQVARQKSGGDVPPKRRFTYGLRGAMAQYIRRLQRS
jgi:hypothetical protein